MDASEFGESAGADRLKAADYKVGDELAPMKFKRAEFITFDKGPDEPPDVKLEMAFHGTAKRLVAGKQVVSAFVNKWGNASEEDGFAAWEGQECVLFVRATGKQPGWFPRFPGAAKPIE